MSKQPKTDHRKTKIPRHSKPSSPFYRKALWSLGILLIIYSLTAAVFSARLYSRADEQPPKTEPSSKLSDDRVVLPVIEPIRTDKELITLKKKELEIAERLLKDFPGRDNSLAIMGNLWYRHGNAVEAEKFWKQALKVNPKLADVHTSMGWLYLKKGDFDPSIAHYRKALEIEPQRSDVHSNIGRALMMSGRLQEAIEELERELRIVPNSSFALCLLGQVYLQQKEYEKAKKYLEMAVTIKPDYANAYHGLITTCTKLGQRDQATTYAALFKKIKAEARKNLKGRKIEYDDFAETQRKAAITYINVGRMYRDNGKWRKAEELLKQAAGLDPQNIVSYLELASVYQADKQIAKALQMHRKISEIQPESAITYLIIGILSGHLKRFDDSEEAFRKLISLAPQKSDGYRELARLYLKTRKNLPQAYKLAYKALTLEASAANCFVFAWACDENGDKVNARAAIEHAIKLDPGNKQYQRLYQVIQQRK